MSSPAVTKNNAIPSRVYRPIEEAAR